MATCCVSLAGCPSRRAGARSVDRRADRIAAGPGVPADPGGETHQVGGRAIVEYWIPAEDLAGLNASIVGLIEVTAEYHKD